MSPVDENTSDANRARLWIAAARELARELPEAASPSLPSADDTPGFRVIRCIGRGAMGEVFEARQEHPERLVALKILRPQFTVDEPERQRTGREIQALAKVNHPGIAHFYSAGFTSDSRPFFAMELIDGRSVTDFADSRGLSLPERLRLFCKICRAVHQVHMVGVIHRDLKPSNILVDPEGNPKIVDFGLACLAEGDSAFRSLSLDMGSPIGTPQYMSPEQATGSHSRDLRMDVYSLGVLLYELTTGQRPYDLTGLSLPAAVTMITTFQPLPASRINRVLRGDLDLIIERAIEKDPVQRCQSALTLAEHIELYLSNQPVPIRPHGPAYHLHKLVSRHKKSFAFAATLVVLLGVFGATIGVMRVQTYRQISAQKSEAAFIGNAMEEMFKSVDAEVARGRDTTVLRAMLDKGEQLARESSQQEPNASARLYAITAEGSWRLGGFDDAVRRYNSAIDAWKGLFGPTSPQIAVGYVGLGDTHWDHADYEQAEAAYVEAYRQWCEVEGPRHPEALACRRKLGRAAQARCKFREAEAIFGEVLDARKGLFGEDHPQVAESLSDLAAVCSGRSDLDKAEAHYLEAVAILRRIPGSHDGELADRLEGLAGVLQSKKDFTGAATSLGEAEELRVRTRGENDWRVSYNRFLLADLKREMEHYDEAAALYDDCLPKLKTVLGEAHWRVSHATRYSAKVLEGKGDRPGALAVLGNLLAERRRLLGDEAEEVTYIQLDLADLLRKTDDGDSRAEAERLCRHVVALRQQTKGDQHFLTASAKTFWGDSLRSLERYDEAERMLLESCSTFHEGDLHPSDRRIRRACHSLTEFYQATGRLEEADKYRESCPCDPGHL